MGGNLPTTYYGGAYNACQVPKRGIYLRIHDHFHRGSGAEAAYMYVLRYYGYSSTGVEVKVQDGGDPRVFADAHSLSYTFGCLTDGFLSMPCLSFLAHIKPEQCFTKSISLSLTNLRQ